MVVLGFFSINKLRSQFFPDVIIETITINAYWPGAGAEDLDSGEVLMQALVPIEENDTVETLTERIHEEEHRILPTVINVQLLLEEVKHVKY